MFALLIAIRNMSIALLLAWMGFSVAPDKDDAQDAASFLRTAIPSLGSTG